MHLPPLPAGTPARTTIRKALIVVTLVALVCAVGVTACVQSAAATALPRYLQTYRYVGQFGSLGSAAGSFDYLTQITFGPNGHLYVADTHNARVQELTTDGTWVRTIGVSSPPDWGGGSTGFDQPQGIAVASNHVWAVDYSSGLAWFDLTGAWQGMSLGPDAPADTFNLPQGAGVDGLGNVFVADTSNARVLKYDSSGAYVCRIAAFDMYSPVAVAVNAAGTVYVADSAGGIERFVPADPDGTAYTVTGRVTDGLSSPSSIALDPAGNIYTADSGLNRVVKIAPVSGGVVATWGSDGTGDGQFTYLSGVAVDPTTGYVYVADRDADRIQSFQLIDRGPKTYAKANLAVVKGKAVTFRYGVAEDVSAKATVWIKIKKGSAVKKTVSLGLVKCGSWLTKKWTCKLAKGSYRWSVYAKDQAGHAQVLLGSKALKVK